MLKTPLNESHKRLGAKMVEFGGFEMPLQYTSIVEEHKAGRENVGVFDVSHMGEIEITGPQALDLVQVLITNDASKLALYQALYTPMCYENGTTVDDLLVFRLSEKYLLIVNASNIQKDFAWIQKNAVEFNAEVKNVSDAYGLLALQGPKSEEVLQNFVSINLAQLKYYGAACANLGGGEALISRTGYTGEDGFEIGGPNELIMELWDRLISAGVKPCGLGARDTLRFEAGYALYGHELDEQTTPIEASLGWAVKEKETDYNGKAVLLHQKREGTVKKLMGFKLLEPGVPRQGYRLYKDGREVGYVTSGMKAITLNEYLGMGYVYQPLKLGDQLEVEIRGKMKQAEIIKLPFYRGSVRRS